MSKYPKGSEWRKWDLHVHTPKSIVQSYGGDKPEIWDQFVAKLGSLPPELKVVGITDYLFIEGYEYLLGRRDEFANIELLIPNIEFRLDTFAGTANSHRRHNFHVLFDETVTVEVIREQLLSCLSKGYKISDKSKWQETPTVRSLSVLGKPIKAEAPKGNAIHDKTDLQVGFDNITYDLKDITECLEKTCFRGKFVTSIGFSEWDQARWDQSAAEKRTLINSSQFCMNSVPDPDKIAAHVEDLKQNNLNHIIFHCSDAHTLDQVGSTLQWMKADPTFAGLKQVLNEFDGRAFVGDMPPNLKPENNVIRRVSIPSSNHWFQDNFELELNRDLVTIIGGRGSGKSALAEAIAYGAGSQDADKDSFLRKATKHKQSVSNTEIVLEWADGTNTAFKVGQLKSDAGLVRYLPQGAVEELCSPEHSAALQQQIENVIFQALPEGDRLGASDFNELRKKALRQFDREKRQIQKRIAEANRQICDIIATIADKPNKDEILKAKQAELKRLKQSLPELPPLDRQAQDELAKLEEQKSQMESAIAVRHTTISMVLDVESRVSDFETSIAEFHTEIEGLLSGTGIAYSDAFKVKLDGVEVKRLIESRIAVLKAEVETIQNGEKDNVATLMNIPVADLHASNLKSMGELITKKSKDTRAFESKKLKYQQQRKLIQDTEATIKAVTSEIQEIEKTMIPECKRLEEERAQLYGSFMETLALEKTKIEELYTPLQESLLSGSETKKRLVFEAKVNYRLLQHNDSGLGVLDRTRRGNFREANALRLALESTWEECTKAGISSESCIQRIGKLTTEFTRIENGPIAIDEQLRDGQSLQDFYDWLYSTEYFEVVSSLTFDGVDLYFLSPGQKGIILMMLYLAIDRDDHRPLIIDQPEENLDNLSVYSDLMEYFRERKQFRQIIMVTHNPNLVVNTDAEQVIVASFLGDREPRLNYESGSLENQAETIPNVPLDELKDGILEKVCDILEGGKIAFGNRNRTYLLSDKIGNG